VGGEKESTRYRGENGRKQRNKKYKKNPKTEENP
jgi:hypothetical protein